MDEVVFLGDMFDFLFGTVAGALAAAEGLFGLLRESLQGKRFVFLAGNHDHHLVRREAEDLLELGIVSDRPAPELREEVRRRSYFRRLLRDRLGGVEVEVRYPAYTFGGVLLTHGHYLDPHARLSGSVGSRALTRLLWSIAAGGREDPRTEEDYESVITLLTELLYTVAQLPHGTIAQRNVYGAVQRAGRLLGAAASPVAAVRRRVEGLPSPTPTSPSPGGPPGPARRCGTGTRAPGSTSRSSAPRRPTPATCATPGPAPRS